MILLSACTPSNSRIIVVECAVADGWAEALGTSWAVDELLSIRSVVVNAGCEHVKGVKSHISSADGTTAVKTWW